MPDPELYTKITDAIQAGKFKEAKTKLDPLLKEEPENIGLLLDAGFINANLDLYDKAESYYQQVVDLAPSSPAGYTGLGFVYKIKGDNEKRLQMFQVALEKSPTNSMIHYELGETYIDMEEFEQARDAFEKTIQFGEAETQAEALQRLAQTYMGLNDPDKAIELGEKVLKDFPDLYTIHYVLAGAESMKKNWTKAEEHIQKYLEMEPEDEDAQEMLKNLREEK